MADYLAEWKYAASVPKGRQDELAAPGSYETLLRRVAADVRVTKAYALPGEDRGLRDCVQPVFAIDLPKTGDALFNGPWGYRAQYWLSASRGVAANRELLSALIPHLLAAVDIAANPDLAKIDVCSSLEAVSAKFWVREGLHLTDSEPGLAIARWATEADRGVDLARLGLQAPVTEKFEIKGALLDPYGNEVVPVRKIRRHMDIHHYGFS